jgi:3-oxoacyl-[acyl-carrier protein] reductase
MKILITGANRGIGLEIARFYKDKTLLLHMRQPSLEMEKEFPNAIFLYADFLQPSFLEDIKQYEECFKNLTCVIHNAGISLNKLAISTRPEEVDQVLHVNLRAPIILSNYLLKFLLKEPESQIIFIASVLAHKGISGSSVYGASKGALLSYVKHLAKEYGSKNLRVNSISPGYIDTEMTASLSPEKIEEYCNLIPLRKFGKPHHVVESIEFLLKNTYITGQDILCDAGLSL